MELNWHNMKKIMFLISFAILLFLGVQHLDILTQFLLGILGLLAPFLAGAVVAFIINVPMRFWERVLFGKAKKPIVKKLARPLSFLLTLLLLIGIVFIVIFLIVPELWRTTQIIRDTVPTAMKQLQIWMNEIAQKYPQIAEFLSDKEINIDWQKLFSTAFNFLKSGAGSVLSSTIQVATSVVNGVFNFFVTFVFSIYLLFQKEKLGSQVRHVLQAVLSPQKTERVFEVASLTSRTFSKFLSGQCIEAVILGTMFFLAMTIFRFPYALLVGVLIAVTALIPIFGAFIGCAFGAFLILMDDPMKAFWFIILFLVLQQLEGNLIYPHVVGGSVGLPSIWVLVAVTVGGSLMGIVGMLIFIPLSSVIYSLFRDWVRKQLQKQQSESMASTAVSEEELVLEKSFES